MSNEHAELTPVEPVVGVSLNGKVHLSAGIVTLVLDVVMARWLAAELLATADRVDKQSETTAGR
jgi:hypothetical protein